MNATVFHEISPDLLWQLVIREEDVHRVQRFLGRIFHIAMLGTNPWSKVGRFFLGISEEDPLFVKEEQGLAIVRVSNYHPVPKLQYSSVFDHVFCVLTDSKMTQGHIEPGNSVLHFSLCKGVSYHKMRMSKREKAEVYLQLEDTLHAIQQAELAGKISFLRTPSRVVYHFSRDRYFFTTVQIRLDPAEHPLELEEFRTCGDPFLEVRAATRKQYEEEQKYDEDIFARWYQSLRCEQAPFTLSDLIDSKLEASEETIIEALQHETRWISGTCYDDKGKQLRQRLWNYLCDNVSCDRLLSHAQANRGYEWTPSPLH